MRSFSAKEKSIVTSLLNQNKEVVTIIDFIRIKWPVGYFEMSTFQQFIRVHLHSEQNLDRIMTHLLEVLTLVKHLEEEGMLSGWNAFPMTDNTVQCGEKSENQTTFFLPDLAVAGNLLQYGNKRFHITHGLKTALHEKFRSLRSKRHRQLLQTIIGGFLLLVVTGLVNTMMHYQSVENGIKVKLLDLQLKNEAVLKNQRLNQVILDSLHWQSKQLMVMTKKISRNTENTKDLEQNLKLQSRQIIQLNQSNSSLYKLVAENHEILRMKDSLTSN